MYVTHGWVAVQKYQGDQLCLLQFQNEKKRKEKESQLINWLDVSGSY